MLEEAGSNISEEIAVRQQKINELAHNHEVKEAKSKFSLLSLPVSLSLSLSISPNKYLVLKPLCLTHIFWIGNGPSMPSNQKTLTGRRLAAILLPHLDS